MSDSTYETVRSLQAELSRERPGSDLPQVLWSLLDAHVIDVSGIGTCTLESGETVYDAEGMLGVGVSLARRADAALSAIPIQWLAIEPSAARLHVLAWLLPTLWGSGSPPDDQVEQLLIAIEAAAPQPRGLSNPLLDVLRRLETTGDLATRIRRLTGDLAPPYVDLVATLETGDARARTDAASALGDLLRGEVRAQDMVRIVAALLRSAASESNVGALESTLFTLGEAADRPGSGDMADWDPLVPLLNSVSDPECLVYVLTALGIARHQRYRAAIDGFRTHTHADVREAAEGAIAELDHTIRP